MSPIFLQKETIKKSCKKSHYVRGLKSVKLTKDLSCLYLLSKFHKLLFPLPKWMFEIIIQHLNAEIENILLYHL
jgi:hypothetical protein